MEVYSTPSLLLQHDLWSAGSVASSHKTNTRAAAGGAHLWNGGTGRRRCRGKRRRRAHNRLCAASRLNRCAKQPGFAETRDGSTCVARQWKFTETKPVVRQAVRSRGTDGGAFPHWQQLKAIIARIQNNHRANARNKVRTECHYRVPR